MAFKNWFAPTQRGHEHTPCITLAATAYFAAASKIASVVPSYSLRAIALAGSPLIPAFVVWCVPGSRLKAELLTFSRRQFFCSLLYTITAAGGAVSFILLLSAMGYLPYSDRPGPGWGNIPVHLPGMEEIRYFAGWAMLVLPGCLFWGNLFFLFFAWSGWFGGRHWLIRAVGGLLCGSLTLLLFAAAGWYIALAPVVIRACGILGALFGVFGGPTFAGSAQPNFPGILRAGGVALGVLALVAVVALPHWLHST